MANQATLDALTLANMVSAAGANVQEQKWVLKAIRHGRRKSQWGIIRGGVNGGRPIQENMDTRKMYGQVVNIPISSGIGGPGVRQDTTLRGNEQKEGEGMFTLSIGMKRTATAVTGIALSQSVMGGSWDQRNQLNLGEWNDWMTYLDYEAEMIRRQTSDNTVYANNKVSIETLRSADTFGTATITRCSGKLNTLGGLPLKDLAGPDSQREPSYWFQTNQYAVDALRGSSTWQQLLADAQVRGSDNSLFAGNLPRWAGQAVNIWHIEDQPGAIPAGSFAAPRAYSGAAITAGTAAFTLTGGRTAANAANTTVLYFANFPAAEWMGFEGVKIAATTNVTYYALIKDKTSGKFMMISYQVNSGNTITVINRLGATAEGAQVTTLGNVTWNSGVWTTDYITDSAAIGSEIYPCNSYGQPWVRTYVLGDQALVAGYGQYATDDGSPALAMGRRIKQVDDYGHVAGIGIATVYGCVAVPNVDGVYCNYAIAYSAYNPPGLPTIV